MSGVSIRIKRMHPDAVIPQYAHSGDSGFDLVATQDVIVEPGETVKVPTGLAFEIPVGYEMQIRPRSGITSKTKLRVQLGTVDAGYRGEVSVIVDNTINPVYEGIPGTTAIQVMRSEYVYTLDASGPIRIDQKWLIGAYLIRRGDRIAQAIIAPVGQASFTVVDDLTDTDRGTGGFGSTEGVSHDT